MSQKKLKVKDIDLLVAYKKNKEPSKYASVMKFVIPPIVLALVVFGVFGFLKFKSFQIQSDIEDTQAKITELQNKIANDPNLSKNNTLQDIIKNTEKYKKLYEDIQSYPQLTQGVFDQLVISANGTLNITGFSFSRDTEMVVIDIETSSESNTELFVRNLKASGMFATVSYTGYTGSEKADDSATSSESALSGLLGNSTKKESTGTSEIVYSATVLCLLK